MPTREAYLDFEAEKSNAIEDIAEKYRERVSVRYIELLNKPEERNREIALYWLAYFWEQSVGESGNVDLATLYWSEVADNADMSFDEINAIPTNQRGDLWVTTRKFISAWSRRQAEIETGFIAEIIEYTSRNLERTQRNIDSLGSKTKKELASTGHDIRPRMKNKRNGS